MAATGILAEAITRITADITALGFRVATDPRNLAARAVYVEIPTFDAFNYNVGDITVAVTVVAAPPGNTDATDWLITSADTIMAANVGVVSGEMISLLVGEQAFPAYRLTVRMSIRRN